MRQLDPSTSSISTSINPIPSEHPPQVDYIGSALFKAAQDGDIEPFNEYQGDLSCLVDGKQNTALHIYVRIGRQANKNEAEFSINFVQQLVDKCPSLLLQPNDSGEIPLHIAIKHGHFDIVKFLIEHAKEVQHEDVEKRSEATTLKQMLRMRDKDENTAMHKAVESGKLDMVQQLVKELDPDFLFSANKSGETPLHIATKTSRGNLLVTEILKNCKSKEYGGPDGSTALHAAVMACSDVSTKKLKETDANGWTPLHYAVHCSCRSIVKLLLESDASAAYITDKQRGMTALHIAAWQGCNDIMEDIISHCPGCCEIVDKRGWNFLHFSVLTLPPKELERILLAAKNKMKDLLIRNLVNEKDVNGITPFVLMFALVLIRRRREYDQVVQFFKRHVSLEYGSRFTYTSSGTKKKEIGELLKDIANDAEILGLPISDYFLEIMKKMEEEKEKMKEEDTPKDVIEEKARESHLLVATLVATVTFAAAFTVPGGYKSDEQGSATLIRDSAFKTFVITNTFAFVASLLAITFHFTLVMFHGGFKKHVKPSLIRRADQLTVFAMAAMVVAFSTGIYTVLQSSSGFAITALFFGIVFFPICIALFLYDICRSTTRVQEDVNERVIEIFSMV